MFKWPLKMSPTASYKVQTEFWHGMIMMEAFLPFQKTITYRRRLHVDIGEFTKASWDELKLDDPRDVG